MNARWKGESIGSWAYIDARHRQQLGLSLYWLGQDGRPSSALKQGHPSTDDMSAVATYQHSSLRTYTSRNVTKITLSVAVVAVIWSRGVIYGNSADYMTELHSFSSAKNLDDRVDVLTQEPWSVHVIVSQYPAGELRSPHLHCVGGV